MPGDFRFLVAAAVASMLLATAGATAHDHDGADLEPVRACFPHDDSGALTGVRLMLPVAEAPQAHHLERAQGSAYETIVDNGPSSNRVDLVFLGDGYTEPELGAYAARINQIVSEIFSQQILNVYGPYFNVHRVDVVSNESGVSNDPDFPLFRDTALQMEFWCNGVERLLCVNTGIALAYASNAPDAQQVLAIANSTKYGGAGYISAGVATGMSDHFWTVDLLLHEMGHSLARLADEYFASGHYSGFEPSEPNASTLAAAPMAAAGTKWSSWLGESFGPQWDGFVDSFEGGRYFATGLHRPSNDSKMRTLGRPFNLPSAEAFIIEIYKVVDPIDAAAAPGADLPPTTEFFVTPMQPLGHALKIQWLINDVPVAGATQTTFRPSDHDLDPGTHQVSAVVWDDVPLVRNESARAQHMTSRRDWTIRGVLGDLNGDGAVGSSDLAILLGSWGPCPPAPFSCVADLTGDGSVGSADLAILLGAWSG